MSEQKIIIGNCLEVLREMPDESVDVCVTSPPYWALRDYGSDPVIWGGHTDCEHEWVEHKESARGGCAPNANVGANRDGKSNNRGHPSFSNYCTKCGAWKGQLGLEPSPLEYIEHLMLIFDEVKRVLKPSGACWVNIGDTYATTSGFVGDTKGVQRSLDSLMSAKMIREGLSRSEFPQKTLCQIPSRFAIAMTDHGWILRNECIWRKENPMPTSTRDRFTVDFEKFFFFVKSPKYYFKQQFETMKQPTAKARFGHQKMGNNNGTYSGRMYDATDLEGRNARTTWTINTQASPLEHCAMFPKELIKRPIDACCPEGGVVLDPFCGSGTVLEYCWEKDIDAIGIEINPEYERIIKQRANTGQTRLTDLF